MTRPVDYRKGRGSKGVHTEDEQVPLGKKGQARNSDSNAQKNVPPVQDAHAPQSHSKHAAGHIGQKPKSRPL